MKRLLIALLLCSASTGALAQNAVTQSGTVTVNRPAKWVQSRQLGDAGGLTGDLNGRGFAPFSITDLLGPGLQFNTAPTTGVYSYFSFGHNASGDPILNVNGTEYALTSVGGGTVTGPVSSAVNEVVLWNNTLGSLVKGGNSSTGTIAGLTATGNVAVGGTLGVTGNTSLGGTLGVTSNASVGGTLGVTGNTTLGMDLVVAGDTTLEGVSVGGSVGVTGNVSITGTLGVTSNTTLVGLLGVTGNTTLGNNLTVGGSTTLQDVAAGGNLTVTGSSTLGPVAIGGTLGVTGNTSVNGTLGVTGNTAVVGTFGVNSTTTLSGNAVVGGTLSVTGATTLGGTTISGDITAAALPVSCAGKPTGTLWNDTSVVSVCP